MHALFLALVAYAGPNDQLWDQKRPDDPFWTNVAVPIARLSQRLQGHVLGTAIQEGMSRKQVEFVLSSNRSSELVGIFNAGGIFWRVDSYPRLGFSITYVPDHLDRLDRVDHVTFLPFFEN